MGVELGTALLISSITGTAVSAFGQIEAGRGESQAARFNADLRRKEAEIAKQKGRLDVARQRKRAEALTSEQRVAFAKSGVRLTGSPLLVIGDSAAEAELDIIVTKFNTRTTVDRLLSEARIGEFEADIAKSTALMRAGQTLLTGATNIALSSNLLSTSKGPGTPTGLTAT